MTPDERYLYVESLASVPAPSAAIDLWRSTQPRSSVPWLVHGAHQAHLAWSDGDERMAPDAPAEVRARYAAQLREAEKSLVQATELEPKDVTPWAYLLRTARGLELGRDVMQERFGHVMEEAQEHRQAHSSMLQSCSLRWGGSHQEMFGFVQLAMMKAGLGCALHVLVAESHIERWLADGGERNPTLAVDYFRQAWVRESICGAATAAFEPGAFIPTIESVRTRNYFAFCLWLAGQHRDALRHFDALGNWLTADPWRHLGEPSAVFQQAKLECSRPRLAAA